MRHPDRTQRAGVIAGRVVDAATGVPLLLATVVATSPALQGTTSEFTDAEGQFRMTGLPAGSYDLLAIYGDAKVRVSSVPVDAGAVRWVTGRLDTPYSEVIILGPCGPPVIDASSAAQKTVIDAGTLKSLPWGR